MPKLLNPAMDTHKNGIPGNEFHQWNIPVVFMSSIERYPNPAFSRRFESESNDMKRIYKKINEHTGRIENEKIHATGVNFYFDIVIQPWKDGKIAIFFDTSEKNLLDLETREIIQDLQNTKKQLEHASQLTALGQLSAGLAHELNQPLQAIMGFSHELLSLPEIQSSDLAKDYTETVAQAAKRMAEMIHNLKSFARKETETFEVVDVNSCFERVSKLTHFTLLDHQVQITWNIPNPTLPALFGKPAYLEQILTNLILNAKDALEFSKNKMLDIRVETNTMGDLEIQVSDSGHGMNTETLSHLFDPFYTTKSPGKGTGLGLSITKNLVEKMNGKISVCSVLDQGTTFTLVFKPLTPKQKEAA